MTCTHQTADDHSERSGVGSRFWKCTDCGTKAVWGPSWNYFGSPECAKCGDSRIHRVSCGCKAAAP